MFYDVPILYLRIPGKCIHYLHEDGPSMAVSPITQYMNNILLDNKYYLHASEHLIAEVSLLCLT